MDFLISMHSGLRWLFLIALLLAIFNAYKKSRTNHAYASKDKTINLVALILAHVQALIGFILYFGNKRYEGFSDMGNSVARFLAIEHLLGMLIAVILITMAYRKTKSEIPDGKKHHKIWVWFLIALLIILISIPWPFRGAGFDYFGYF